MCERGRRHTTCAMSCTIPNPAKGATPMTEQDKKRMVTAVFRDRTQANRVYTWLRDRGYTSDEINVLMSDQTRAAYRTEDEDEIVSSGSHAAEGMATGGATGTAGGATLAASPALR